MPARIDGRRPEDLRPVVITPGFIRHADGSVLIEVGETRVICTATVEESVPQFLRDTGRGWVTAEYGMLPGSSTTRIPRESARGRVGGPHARDPAPDRAQPARGHRPRARSARARIWIDCDVIQADGGTRTASITGSYVALALAHRAGCASAACIGATRCATRSRRSASASSTASCSSTSATPRTARPRST